MNKIAIVYQSKYGATKSYVDLLSKEIACDIFSTKQVEASTLEPYDTILFAGGVYASNIAGIGFYKKNKESFTNKNVAIFAVGFSSYNEENIASLKTTNLSNDDIPLFYGRGCLDIKSMSTIDRFLVKTMKKALQKKDESQLSLIEISLRNSDSEAENWIDHKYLVPILEYLKKKAN